MNAIFWKSGKLCYSTRSTGSAASGPETRKRQHYARLGYVSFDECHHKISPFAIESCRQGTALLYYSKLFASDASNDLFVLAALWIIQQNAQSPLSPFLLDD